MYVSARLQNDQHQKLTLRIDELAAGVVAAHGLIHLIGFVVPFGIARVDGFADRTTALNGLVELGEAGSVVLGVTWLLLAVGFVVAGVGLWRGRAWRLP